MDASLQPLPAFRPEPTRRDMRRDTSKSKTFALGSQAEIREESPDTATNDDDDLPEDVPAEREVGRSLDVTA